MQNPPASMENGQSEILNRVVIFTRLVSHFIGIILVLIGVYGAYQVFSIAFKAVNDPSTLSSRVEKIEILIEAEKLLIQTPEFSAELGSLISFMLIIILLLTAGWISISIIIAGARLTTLNFDERQQIKILFREFMNAMKMQNRRASKSNPFQSELNPPPDR